MEKFCPKCGLVKDESCFNKNFKRKLGLQPYCKLCRKEIDRQSYLYNPKRKEAIRASDLRRYKKTQDYIYGYLLAHPCVDCGEVNPIVLDFDHLKDKKFNIANSTRLGLSINNIEEEISKCEIRCANCHRIVTAERCNSWKYKYAALV